MTTELIITLTAAFLSVALIVGYRCLTTDMDDEKFDSDLHRRSCTLAVSACLLAFVFSVIVLIFLP